MGVEFDPAELYASGVESVPRGHKTTGNGAALSEVLDREVNRRNIDVSRGCRVTALHTDEHGCVRGVVLDGETVSANSVIIRTEEHTSELQSLMRISSAVFCFTKK